jgi:hypothetical protein
MPYKDPTKRKAARVGEQAHRKKRYWSDPGFRAKEMARHKKYNDTDAHREDARRRARVARGAPQPTRPAPERCECCGRVDTRHLNADHDHNTGVFRGWLCFACNIGIGKLGDNYDGVLRALRYLGETLI